MTRSRSIDRGLLALRLALGVVFILHGWQKLTVYGIGGVSQMLGGLGVPLPAFSAVLTTAAEFLGGIALLTGAGTRIAAAIVAFNMLVALTTVHLANGFFLPNGFEYAFTLLMANLALVFTGAGAYSVDAWFRHETTARPAETVPATSTR